MSGATDTRIGYAEQYLAAGCVVLQVWGTVPDGTCRCPDGPSCQSPGKHPLVTPPSTTWHTASDPVALRTLLGAGSQPNWGYLPPLGVFGWDLDGDGWRDRLAALEVQLGPLPPTTTTATPNDGEHRLYRWPVAVDRPGGKVHGFVARWPNERGRGYLVGPGSSINGRVYQLVHGSPDAIADFPLAWAQAAAAGVAQGPDRGRDDGPAITVGRGYTLPDGPIPAGQRYNATRDYVASRYNDGLSPEEIRAGFLAVVAPRFVPPKPDDVLRADFERAWRGTAERLGPPRRGGAAPGLDDADPEPGPDVPSDARPRPPGDAVYHGLAGDFVRAVGDHTEADPVALLAEYLTIFGALAGRARWTDRGTMQGANLYTVLVGDTATGRKGTAHEIARTAFTEAFGPGWQSIVCGGLGSGEGLIGYYERHQQEVKDGKVAVPETRGLILETEYARLLQVASREGQTLSAILRQGWDGVPLGRNLAREGHFIPEHHTCLLGHVTPDEVRAKLTTTDMANGYGNRHLWLYVERWQLLARPPAVAALVAPLASRLRDAVGQAHRPGKVLWTSDAEALWEPLYMSRSQRYGLWGALVARGEAQVVRLALVYALLDSSPVIDVVHLQAALALWAYAVRSVRHIFGDLTGNRNADALRRRLLVSGRVKRIDARRLLGLRSAADVDDAIDALVRAGLARVEREANTGGRPASWVVSTEVAG